MYLPHDDDATNGALRQAQDELRNVNRRPKESAYADQISLARRVWAVGGVAQYRRAARGRLQARLRAVIRAVRSPSSSSAPAFTPRR